MSQPAPTTRPRRRQTRRGARVAEALAKVLISVGGVGTILAVTLIFAFLVWVVVPIFRGASAGPGAAPAEAWAARAAEKGVRMSAIGPDQVRFVTHSDVSDRQVDEAIARLARKAA